MAELRVFALVLSLLATPSAAQRVDAPPAARADHVALHVADVDASARFYTEMFGLRPLPSPVREVRWLDLTGGISLHLIPGRTATVADDRNVHLALSVRDYDGLVARLKKTARDYFSFDGRRGVSDSGRGDGVRQIFIRDLDGYWIEINDILGRTGH